MGRCEDGSGLVWLTPRLASELLEAIEVGRAELTCSLDLGLSCERVELSPSGARPAEGRPVPVAELGRVARAGRGVFLVSEGGLEPVQIAGEQFYKLIPTDEAPTVEISGVQMHRTTGTAPFRNAMACARTVVRRGAAVLDTCGGLGYTATAAVRLEAASVVSIERDPHVTAIARLNPWSAEYLSSPAITRMAGDARDEVAGRPDGSFDAILHDPPRFSLAGELYGAAFYAELARVLRRRGRLFHYTGAPYSRSRGRSFVDGVMRRLREAGFSVRREKALQAVLAERT